MLWRGTVYVLMSAVCYAFLSILAKTAYGMGYTPLMLLFMEKFLAGAVQWVILSLFQKRLLKVSAGQFKHLLLMTLCGSAFSSLGFFMPSTTWMPRWPPFSSLPIPLWL